MLKEYFVIKCNVRNKKYGGNSFEAVSDDFLTYPTNADIEECIEGLENEDYEVYYARVEKQYKKLDFQKMDKERFEETTAWLHTQFHCKYVIPPKNNDNIIIYNNDNEAIGEYNSDKGLYAIRRKEFNQYVTAITPLEVLRERD